MRNSLLAGKALLWFMAIYHVLVGVLLIVSGELSIRFASLVLAYAIEPSPALGVAGEVLGCYMIAFGLMLAVVARNPERHRDLLLVAAAFVAVRVVQRVVFADKVIEVFAVPEARYWGSCVFVTLLGLGLLVFWRSLPSARPAVA